MQNAIKVEIKRLCRKIFAKAKAAAKLDADYKKKFLTRTDKLGAVPKIKPSTFPHRHFDPVYCSRNANFLAKTIWHKVLSDAYEPIPAVNHKIPKPDGSKRDIMAFAIPDAALANIILRRTRERNKKRLSPSSYAYHPDKNVFDAILALTEYRPDGNLFAIQIDFEKYFDNIPAWYLNEKIDDEARVSLTPHERYIFRAFMHHKHATKELYATSNFSRRHIGTPQGSSVSLLLANLANHDLDVRLAGVAGKFVRFADDVVALCDNYDDAQILAQCFSRHCQESGLKLNSRKSPGVAIIASIQQEMRTYPSFDYLGYRFSATGLTMPERTIRRLKTRVSRLVNLYLIQYLEHGFNHRRASISPNPFDWDLLGLVYELRRSLYGGLTEADITGYILHGKRLPKMRGLMGFYCLLDDPAPLKELDGWILTTVRRAMAERNKILQSTYNRSTLCPSNASLAIGDWLSLKAWDNRAGDLPETRMPSLVRGWRAARKHFFTFGLENVQAPNYGFYTNFNDVFDY
jgi:RNA-directed DNA polymerase